MSARKIKADATKRRYLFVPALVRLRRGTPSEVHDQGYQQQHEEYIEDDLSDASRGAGKFRRSRERPHTERSTKNVKAQPSMANTPLLACSARFNAWAYRGVSKRGTCVKLEAGAK